MNSLKWFVKVDRNLVLRIQPTINGVDISERIAPGCNVSAGGLGGLSLGILDAFRWPKTGPDGTLRLLSCNCGPSMPE